MEYQTCSEMNAQLGLWFWSLNELLKKGRSLKYADSTSKETACLLFELCVLRAGTPVFHREAREAARGPWGCTWRLSDHKPLKSSESNQWCPKTGLLQSDKPVTTLRLNISPATAFQASTCQPNALQSGWKSQNSYDPGWLSVQNLLCASLLHFLKNLSFAKWQWQQSLS